MSTFILIHGAWHGRWCWDELIPLLEAGKHKVVAIDLPGSGDDPTPPGDVSLAAYCDAVVHTVCSQGEPVVLVGHSMGGLVITQVAELVPERVAALVYVAAFLPDNGQSLKQLADQGAPLSLEYSADGLTAIIPPQSASDTLFADVHLDICKSAVAKLRPQALAPLGTPVETTPERFGSVPRHYVECIRDRAIPIEAQRKMAAVNTCVSIQSLETGHSPFLSAPAQLANALLNTTS